MASRLVAFFIRSYFDEATKSFPQIKVSQLRMLPIRTINFSSHADKSTHDRMVSLVEAMLDLHKRLEKVKTEHEKTALKRQIQAIDKQIDDLVYQLYGLTDKEINIIEQATE